MENSVASLTLKKWRKREGKKRKTKNWENWMFQINLVGDCACFGLLEHFQQKMQIRH